MLRGDYHILDKDLDRLTQAERASRHVSRPLQMLGIATALIVAGAILGAVAGLGLPGQTSLVAGVAIAVYLGLNIGANDVANSVGAAVGARALPLWLGLVAVACANVAGALLAGDQVTRTIAAEIVAQDRMLIGAQPGRIMAAALVAAALWMTLANWARAPVSTTHSVIGAITGAAVAGLGYDAINWTLVGGMALGWIAAPVATALLAALLLALLRWRVRFAPDQLRAARLWLPLMIGAMAAIFMFYLLTLASHPVLSIPLVGLLGVALVVGLVVFAASRWQLDRQAARQLGRDTTLKSMLRGPLIATALLSGFAHGANDVGNVAGPLAVVLQGAGWWGASITPPMWVGLVAGLSVAAGSVIFGRRLVRTVGSSITRLNPARAFCAALAGASVVLVFSSLGLPVSTTHCAVGGIFGVGFYREWEDRRRRKLRKPLPREERHRRKLVRRSHVWTTIAAWCVTVPCAALVGAAVYSAIWFAARF